MFEQYLEPSNHRFVIGESIALNETKPLRDMLNPENGLSKQPSHTDDIPEEMGPDCEPSRNNDNCGVHILSGIPNKFAATAIRDLGWIKTRDVFYNVTTKRLHPQSNFADYSAAIIAECRALDFSASDLAKITAALNSVGL